MFRILLFSIISIVSCSFFTYAVQDEAVKAIDHQSLDDSIENERFIKLELLNLAPEEWCSRFITDDDRAVFRVSDIPLRSTWWSRPFEYAWASQFAGPSDIALDAACGISHPFKWLLCETCKEAWACDIDPRIASFDRILQETKDDLGSEAFEIIIRKPHLFANTWLVYASICNLPNFMPKFDRIFCISTLEHMNVEDRKHAMTEFAHQLSPNGLVVLTVDYPSMTPEELIEIAHEAGLCPAGAVEMGIPPMNALRASGLSVYRCVLELNDDKREETSARLALAKKIGGSSEIE